METQTENRIKYADGRASIGGVMVEWNLIWDSAEFPNEPRAKNGVPPQLHERFLFTLTAANGAKYQFDFYNSDMERGISQTIRENMKRQPITETRRLISSRHMWGGYSKCPSYAALEIARAYHLIYGALNSNAQDITTQAGSFSDFCAEFGYDEDSMSAHKIFTAINEARGKWNQFKRSLDDEQRDLFETAAAQEDDKFKNAILKVTGHKERD